MNEKGRKRGRHNTAKLTRSVGSGEGGRMGGHAAMKEKELVNMIR